MKIFNKKIVLILLIALVIIGFTFNKKENKQIVLDDVKVISNNDKFAIKYEKENGQYEEYTGEDFPKGYILNINESKCLDKDENELENTLSFENNSVTITSSLTNYCYLTFDKSAGLKIIESKPDNLNGNQAGMYRYQGSHTDVNNNYICFGTDDLETCKGNEDKYMYRIIGITEDGEVEVIKKTALGDTGVLWNSVYRTTWNQSTESKDKTQDADVKWSQSDLFKRINGESSNGDNLFIGNSTYDYLTEDSKWYNKIANTEWVSGQLYWSNTYFELSKIYNIESGTESAPHYEEASPYYYNGGTDEIRNDEYEQRRKADGITCTKYNNGTINYVTCYKTVTEQFNDKVKAKIGLMHVYEYDYAVQKGGLNCFYNNVYDRSNGTDTPKQELTTCKNSWIHISNNDTTVKGNGIHDWTLSRFGFSPNGDSFSAWGVYSAGYVDGDWVTFGLFARPVFYLKSSITKISGNGEITSPYILSVN